MNIVVAPDSYKGTFNQYEIATIMGEALTDLGHQSILKPMSDGGDGLLTCFRNEDYEEVTTNVTGPEGQTVEASYCRKGQTAVIETAEACGLHLVGSSNPGDRTSFGVGELILDAVDNGAQHIILGLGGSATNDGGYGMLLALGGAAVDTGGMPVGVFTRDIGHVAEISLRSLQPLEGVQLTVASDVTHPLFGVRGATRAFGPQKGVQEADVAFFESLLSHLRTKISDVFQDDFSDCHGAGAAGGLGWMLMNLGAEMKPGGLLVAEMIHLENAIMKADMVITGEGKTDASSVHGKVPATVAQLADRHQKPCHLISGQVTGADTTAFASVYPLSDGTRKIEDIIEETPRLIRQKIQRIVT